MITHHYKPVKTTDCGILIKQNDRLHISSFWEYVNCKKCLKVKKELREIALERQVKMWQEQLL